MIDTTISKEVADIARHACNYIRCTETPKARMQIALNAICEICDAAKQEDDDDPQELAATYKGMFDIIVEIAEKAL